MKNINQECWFSSASCQQHSPVCSWKWFLKSIQQFFWSSQLCKCLNIWRIVTRKYFYFSVLLEYQDNCQPLDMWRWWMCGWSSLSPTPSSSLPATASRKLVAIREKLWWTVKVVSNIYLFIQLWDTATSHERPQFRLCLMPVTNSFENNFLQKHYS